MTRKHYQWLAIAVLIIGPVLTSLLSEHLPGRQSDNPIELAPPPQAAEPVTVMQAAPPPPPPSTIPQAPMSTDGAPLDASPTLNTGGAAVSGADISIGATAAPAPMVAQAATPTVSVPAPPPPANMVPKFREGPVRD